MKILYDHQIFTSQKYGGISRYFCELYSHLITMDTIHPEISVVYSENCYYQELFHQRLILPDQKTLGKYLNFGKNIAINKINEYNCKNQIRHGNFDIFHPTNYNTYFLKTLKPHPYVLTVYDMIHELFPDMVKRRDNTAIQKKKAIECATKIIAISDNTKTDIIKFYDIEPQKIEVIHLATSLKKYTPDIFLNLPQKYILFVGNRRFHKNFTFFLTSISCLLNDEKNLCLICAGGGVFSDDEIHLLNDLKIKKRVLHYPIVNDSTLSQLYRKAILFVFPSLYEGFGIPVLEAFSCGCPVAASNCSSLPEVGGEAVNYFDPNNSDSIQKVVEDIVHNNSLQDSLRTYGYQRLKLFSWEKTALTTKNVYDSLLSQ
ncbi:MAG: glycosyltransferase family 1 protein [Methanoregula sp.]|nr:glycosyltransferase family 1 protein [Methanoregula sp.]